MLEETMQAIVFNFDGVFIDAEVLKTKSYFWGTW
jgi:hypothetical protein